MPQCGTLFLAAPRHDAPRHTGPGPERSVTRLRGRPLEDVQARLIKRYGSRKLYDTRESRYISLEEIAQLIRRGEDIQVVDNTTSEEVTAQTLTQIILEEGRNGRAHLPAELLHQLVRSGGQALNSGMEQVQKGLDRLVQRSMDRLAPLREAREETALLRRRLEALEQSLAKLEPPPRDDELKNSGTGES